MKYEYMRIEKVDNGSSWNIETETEIDCDKLKGLPILKLLNNYGRMGWELCSFDNDDFYLKRVINESK